MNFVDPDCRAAHKHRSCAGGACVCPCHCAPGQVNSRAAHFVHHGYGWRPTRFMAWIDQMWRDWWEERGVTWTSEMDRPHARPEDHQAFDVWLERRCPMCGRPSRTDSQPYPRAAGLASPPLSGPG